MCFIGKVSNVLHVISYKNAGRRASPILILLCSPSVCGPRAHTARSPSICAQCSSLILMRKKQRKSDLIYLVSILLSEQQRREQRRTREMMDAQETKYERELMDLSSHLSRARLRNRVIKRDMRCLHAFFQDRHYDKWDSSDGHDSDND